MQMFNRNIEGTLLHSIMLFNWLPLAQLLSSLPIYWTLVCRRGTTLWVGGALNHFFDILSNCPEDMTLGLLANEVSSHDQQQQHPLKPSIRSAYTMDDHTARLTTVINKQSKSLTRTGANTT